MAKARADHLIGQVINNFEIQHVIGQGGMGIVYRAYHPDLQLYAAVKVMLPDLANQPGFFERFLQEARSVARLGHPNIVDVINFGRFEGSYYLILDYIEGPNLRELIVENRNGLPLWDVVQIGWQVADVLVYSHAEGVLHRDLKPDNILLTHSVRPNRPYRAIVTDFGLAKLGRGGILETQEGISVGTPAYMSPEQCTGINVDGRTDVYALGVMLFEMLTGSRPYRIRNLADAIECHKRADPPTPRERNQAVPSQLDDLVRRMLIPDLSQRIASAADVTDELQELLIALSMSDRHQQFATQLQARFSGERVESVKAASTQDEAATPTLVPQDQAKGPLHVQVAFKNKWDDKLYLLKDKPVIVGRLQQSDIVLSVPGQRPVSKQHCEILLRDNRVLIRDLGSTNGTVLGKIKLQSNVYYEWKPGTEVLLGPFTLALRAGKGPSDAVASPAVAGFDAPDLNIPNLLATKIHPTFKLSCPSAVPSRLPLALDNPIIIGRSVESDMVLDHPHVSKLHCRIQFGSKGPEIVDLRSTNGTFLGDRRLPPNVPVPWRGGPTINVGPFVVTLEEKGTGIIEPVKV